MIIIGENIHVIAPKIKRMIEDRDGTSLQELAKAEVAGGADILDLNIGPQRRTGPEVMTWMVNAIQEAVEIPLSFDTTNLGAIEVGLKLAKQQAMVNSASAEPERLANVPPLAGQYNARLIALMMGKGGIPVTAEERVNFAIEKLIPRAVEVGIPMEDLFLDPLIMTVAGCQEYCPPAVEAVRYVKMGMDPAPMTTGGLSNVSNHVPEENRSLLNRVYLVMLMAAGIDSVIADALDQELRETIRIVEERDDSTAAGSLLLKLHDATAAMEELEPSDVDMSEPEQVDIWKTVRVLLNKVIYTDSYLRT